MIRPISDSDCASEQAHQAPAADKSRLMWGSYIGMLIVAASLNALPVCLTAIGKSLNLVRKARLGAISSSIFAGRIPAILASGPLADRWGLRPLLFAGAVGTLAGFALMAVAPGYLPLLGAAVILGAFSGIFDVLLDPLVCRLRPDEKTSALNLLHAFYPAGAVVTVAASNALLAWRGNWRLVFAAMGLPPVMYFLLVLPCRFPRLQREGQRTSAKRLLTNSALLLAIALMVIAAVCELGPAQWMPAYMENVFAWPSTRGAHLLMAFNIMMAAGRFATSRLSGIVRPAILLAVAGVSCSICLAVAAVAGSSWLAAAALGLLGAAVATMWPGTVADTADRFPEGGATMFSLLVAAGNAGGLIGPATVGVVADYAGLRWAMGFLGIFPIIAALVFLTRIVAASESATPNE